LHISFKAVAKDGCGLRGQWQGQDESQERLHNWNTSADYAGDWKETTRPGGGGTHPVDFDLRGSAQRRALPGAATGASPGHPNGASDPAPRSKVGQTRRSNLFRPAGTGKALLSEPRITVPHQTQSHFRTPPTCVGERG
jgi:hypothetical protein